MSDNIIRNPNRIAPRPQIQQQPEHKRLGIKPLPFNNFNNQKSVQPNPVIVEQKSPYEIYDDVFIVEDEHQHHIPSDAQMIDNNNFVDFPSEIKHNAKPKFAVQADNIYYNPSNPVQENINPQRAQKNLQNAQNKINPAHSPKEGEYILMIWGHIVVSGALENIQNRVEKILCGEDEVYTPDVKIDDLVVLERKSIKVGVLIG